MGLEHRFICALLASAKEANVGMILEVCELVLGVVDGRMDNVVPVRAVETVRHCPKFGLKRQQKIESFG